MHVTAAIIAAICACFGLYLNDVLSRRRQTLSREGLLREGFDYAEAAGMLDNEDTDERLVRFGMLRMLANGMGLLFFAVSALLLYGAIFVEPVVDGSFWASWAATTGASALYFWAGR